MDYHLHGQNSSQQLLNLGPSLIDTFSTVMMQLNMTINQFVGNAGSQAYDFFFSH